MNPTHITREKHNTKGTFTWIVIYWYSLLLKSGFKNIELLVFRELKRKVSDKIFMAVVP